MVSLKNAILNLQFLMTKKEVDLHSLLALTILEKVRFQKLFKRSTNAMDQAPLSQALVFQKENVMVNQKE